MYKFWETRSSIFNWSQLMKPWMFRKKSLRVGCSRRPASIFYHPEKKQKCSITCRWNCFSFHSYNRRYQLCTLTVSELRLKTFVRFHLANFGTVFVVRSCLKLLRPNSVQNFNNSKQLERFEKFNIMFLLRRNHLNTFSQYEQSNSIFAHCVCKHYV